MSNYPIPAPPAPAGYTPAKNSGTGNLKPRLNRVVIHSAVIPCEPGRARQLADWSARGTTGGSWHYATDPKEAIQCAGDDWVCWHAPPNRDRSGGTIGIEMADWPKGGKVTAAIRKTWRWRTRAHKNMLAHTARLTAELCLAYDIPIVFLSPADLKAGKRGITTHNNVSRAFGQSSHWDPGMWPRRRFMKMVRAEAAKIRAEHATKQAPAEPTPVARPVTREETRGGSVDDALASLLEAKGSGTRREMLDLAIEAVRDIPAWEKGSLKD